jgi:hypothetical protein
MIPGTDINLWYVFPQALGFGIFFVAAMAELSRPPFDMPIGDSELVFGYMTEYSGIKFAMYLLTEYAGMVSMSALMVVLYLGGWQILPGVPLPGCEGAAGCSTAGSPARCSGWASRSARSWRWCSSWSGPGSPTRACVRTSSSASPGWCSSRSSLLNLAVITIAKVVF